jgi:hypothetical protein
MLASERCIIVILSALLFCMSCAVSPEAEERRRAMEEEIEAILSEPLAREPQRCLSQHEYRDFRPIDDRRILFEGRRGELWLNTLRARCPDLRHSSVLVVRSFHGMGRLCDADTFMVADWFTWPWYQRWPWYWGWGWGASATCLLGEFQPVNEAQVDAIKEALRYK